MPVVLREDELERIHESFRRVITRADRLEIIEALLLQLLEKIVMSVDPNVQKVLDDAAAIKATLETVLARLTDAQTHISQLNLAVQNAQAAGLSGDNVQALQSAAATLEAAIGEAQAVISPPAPAPAADPAAAPAADSGSAPATG